MWAQPLFIQHSVFTEMQESLNTQNSLLSPDATNTAM